MVVNPTQVSTLFQKITVRQLGQSLTQPDYYHSVGPFGGYFVIGVLLGDDTWGDWLTSWVVLCVFPARMR